MGYIYTITNKINNKKYVGQTINPQKRWSRHKLDAQESDQCLYRAMRKYGIENFDFTIVEECKNEEMSEREIFWIEALDTYISNGKGYNMTHGGEILTGEDNPFYGKKHSEKTRKTISEMASARIGELNPFYGKHHSEDTKEKISKANKGKKRTEEWKKQLSQKNSGELNPFYGKKHSVQAKEKMRKSAFNRVPYNSIKWEAYNENSSVLFPSVGKIMNWAQENNLIKEENFTMAKLKRRLINSEKKHIKFIGYYWKKSVETIENIRQEEVSRVGEEIGTSPKCEDTIIIV